MIRQLDKWQLVSFGCAGAMFVVMGMGRFSYASMVPALVLSGQVSSDHVGWVGGINLASFFCGAAISETVRKIWRPEQILIGAILVSVAALLASSLPYGAVWLGIWRGLLGLTAGLVMVQGLAITTAIAPQRKRPMATGLMFAGVGVGILFSGVLVPWLLHLGIFVAWIGIAVASVVAAVFALFGLRAAVGIKFGPVLRSEGVLFVIRRGRAWRSLILAYFLFSFGITPHTLYWVDYLERELALGTNVGGIHWAAVGFFSVLGPFTFAWLAGRLKTSWAVVVAFLVLGSGVILPGLMSSIPALWVSTIIFGTQPGVSAVKATLIRDLGSAQIMPSVLRVMIMASALGGAAGGVVFPAIFAVTANYELMFLIAGGGMFIAAIAMASNCQIGGG